MSGDRNSAIGTLTVLQGRSLGYARDDGAKRYQNFAALLIFMRRTTPALPILNLFQTQLRGTPNP